MSPKVVVIFSALVSNLPSRFSNAAHSIGGFLMFCVSLRLNSSRVIRPSFALLAAFTLIALSVSSYAQRPRNGVDEPLWADFKGVRIGMSTDEARKKLGNPRDKGDDQDFYIFNDNQAVQVYYDKSKAVSAISIDFMTGASDIPVPRDVIGGEADTRPDGSAYKMVRYPKAGYWVSYSKTAGKEPTITITMQKIEH
jgi:hypothetical protein